MKVALWIGIGVLAAWFLWCFWNFFHGVSALVSSSVRRKTWPDDVDAVEGQPSIPYEPRTAPAAMRGLDEQGNPLPLPPRRSYWYLFTGRERKRKRRRRDQR